MENPSEVYFGYTLTIYCCLEDETMMERPYAENKKIKLLTLNTHSCLRHFFIFYCASCLLYCTKEFKQCLLQNTLLCTV